MECNTTAIDHMDLKPWIDQEPKRKLPITKRTLEKALRLGTEQYRRLELAEFGRIAQQRGSIPTDRNSAVFTHSNLMAPKRESLDLARTAGILRETTKVLLRGYYSLIYFSKKFDLEKGCRKKNVSRRS